MPSEDCDGDENHKSDHGSHHHESHFKREYLDKKTERYENSLFTALANAVDESTTMFHNFLMQFRGEPYPYYHRIYKRVPQIDECYLDDVICQKEADAQYQRDRLVESQIVRILRKRKTECIMWYSGDRSADERESLCTKEREDYDQAIQNYFIKYGDIGYYNHVRDVYAKQKHRMVWERRHGPINTPVEKAEKLIEGENSMIEILRATFGKVGLPKNMT